jgi:hypothetical protein
MTKEDWKALGMIALIWVVILAIVGFTIWLIKKQIN